MMMRTKLVQIILLAALLFLVAPPARAQTGDVSVKAELAARSVYLGDPIMLQVVVEGSDTPDEPTVPAIDGVDIVSAGGGSRSSSYISILNGRRQETHRLAYVFQYSLTPRREGTFTIPPFRVTVDGKTFTTERLQFSAVEPPVDPDSLVRIELDAEDAYVGQPVRARVSWFFEGRADNVSFRASDLPDAIDVLPLPPQAPQGTNVYRLNAFGQEVQAVEVRAVRGGLTRPALAFEVMLIPRAPGEYQVGPVIVAFDRIGYRTERRMSRSEAPTLSVKPLPSEGRPADFTGLIGDFSLDVSAEPTDVNVGDPIALHLTIHGPEPLGAVDAPDLATDPEIAERFKPSADGWQRQPQDTIGVRTFDTTIRARTADVDAIPPIRLPYFDPVSGQYKYAQTDPIPLEVQRTRRVTAADAIMAPGRASPTSSRRLERADGGVWALQTDPDLLLAQSAPDLGAWVTRPAVVTLLATPPAAYLAASVVVFARRRSDPARGRRRRALRRSRALLAQGQAPESVRAWASGVTGLEADSITAADVRALGDDDTRDDAALLANVLMGGERARFGADMAASGFDASDLRGAMRRLERHLDREGGAA
ncbi:MAG: BatD family protein [Phycisphaerales bacterium]